MDQLANVLWAIDKAHIVPQRALDCAPGLGGLNQVDGPNCLTPFSQNIHGKKNNIFTRCTNRNLFDMLLTAVANVRNGQTDIFIIQLKE